MGSFSSSTYKSNKNFLWDLNKKNRSVTIFTFFFFLKKGKKKKQKRTDFIISRK